MKEGILGSQLSYDRSKLEAGFMEEWKQKPKRGREGLGLSTRKLRQRSLVTDLDRDDGGLRSEFRTILLVAT